MRLICRIAAATLLWAAFAWTASAQDMTTQTVAGTTISLGGGAQYLALPDVRFNFTTDNTGKTLRKYNDSNFEEYGGGITGRIETPLGQWGSRTVFGAVHGFYASLEDSDRRNCQANPNISCAYDNIVDTPGRDKFPAQSATGFGDLLTNTSRDVNNWGLAAEAKFAGPERNSGMIRSLFWAAGADVRGLDQDIGIHGNDALQGRIFNYRESLDTTYVGGYAAIGGEYSLFPALSNGWGLRSFVTAQLGVYNADVDYSGHYQTPLTVLFGSPGADTRLNLSEDHVAVIGGLKFETRKQFGPRTSLSLLTDYEWYSWAPEMHYNDSDTIGGIDAFPGKFSRTSIGDDDAFSVRTSLRLNVGLGPRQLYSEPLK